MSLFREIPPTAGMSISVKDLLAWLKFKGHADFLANDLKEYLQVDYVKITYSGTAALYLILESLKELSSKRTVIIPAYICPLVPLAVLRAGLKVEICDIGKGDFNFNLTELENLCSANHDILAVIPAHLGGIPVDFDSLKKVTQKYNCFIIEDCAQSLGAIYKNKKVGTLGDFSFFSLCRGKGLTIYEGGAIALHKKEHRTLVESKARELIRHNFLSESLKILELFGYWIFYRPQLFWFAFRLPQIFWNMQGKKIRAAAEDYSPDFSMHEVSGFRKWLGHVVFSRLEDQISKQRQKALYYRDRLKGRYGIRVIEEQAYARATYPYLTLIFDAPLLKQKALKALKNSGLGVSQIYLCTITDYDYLKPLLPNRVFPDARYLAERELTLSTSIFLSEQDLDSVLDRLGKL